MVDEVWQSFWKDICENADGTLNIEQIKKELADYKVCLDEVSKVYDDITGGRLSKPLYKAETVLAEYYAKLSEDYISKDDLGDLVEDIEVAIADFLADHGVDVEITKIDKS
jgi:hypothetical protein